MLNISATFNKPPEAAVRWFREKGITVSGPWQSWWKEANTHSFTVARLTALDVLTAVRDQVDRAVAEGITEEEFIKTLKPRLIASGWWTDTKTGELVPGTDGSPGAPDNRARLNTERLRTIYRTNVATAYRAGEYESMKAAARFFPYWQYNTLDDIHVRKAHAALDNMVFRHDDPIWAVAFPPNGFNCRCTVRALSQKQFDEKGLLLSDGSKMLVKGTYNKRDGTKLAITGIKVNGQTHFIDPGWDYNPAKSQAASLSDIADQRIAAGAAGQADKEQLLADLEKFFKGPA
jgi:SPP1 gp7 family putative phage head morphogenesis protein